MGGIPADITEAAGEVARVATRKRPETALRILHFNDVYNVEDRANAPFGGAGRFCTKVKALRPAPSAAFTPALVLFSGDALSPSAMSTVTKGEQMVPILNVIGVDVAMAGNHDLDFGEDVLSEAVQASSFPWLLTNCLRKADAKPLGGCIPTLVKEWHGWRIGIMGLIEQDWLATLATVDPEDVVFTDFIKAGTAAAASSACRVWTSSSPSPTCGCPTTAASPTVCQALTSSWAATTTPWLPRCWAACPSSSRAPTSRT